MSVYIALVSTIPNDEYPAGLPRPPNPEGGRYEVALAYMPMLCPIVIGEEVEEQKLNGFIDAVE